MTDEKQESAVPESQSPTGFDVGSTLRDRIANTLYHELSIELPAAIRGADKVIAELGLRKEHRERSYGNWPNQPQVVYRNQHRYVTRWENDE